IWKNRLVALIILQKSTFLDIRDTAPKVWFGRAACTKPYQSFLKRNAKEAELFFGEVPPLFMYTPRPGCPP
ncbi:MAG: hypothetical protein ACLS4U_06675, partial [Faecalibacterium prausnitzii]